MDKLVKTITMQQQLFKGHDDKQSQTAVHAWSVMSESSWWRCKTTTVAWQWKTGKSLQAAHLLHAQEEYHKKKCVIIIKRSLIYKDCRKSCKKIL